MNGEMKDRNAGGLRSGLQSGVRSGLRPGVRSGLQSGLQSGVRSNVATSIGLLLAVAVIAWSHHGGWTAWRVAGVVVGGAGLVLLLVARWQLGAAFSVQAKARHLVTTGVYSRIRNPIYVAGELVLLGAAIFMRSWMPLALVAVTIPVQVVRARKEAEVLRSAFGEEYDTYRAGTWL